MSSPGDNFSQLFPEDLTSTYNSLWFMVKQILGYTRTMTPVKVMKVYPGDDSVSPVGTVDVLPLVNMLDGAGKSSQHITVFGLPYFRNQGGMNAIICDPKVNDLGLAIISDRDISSVKKNKAQSNPGSYRRFELSDGVYLGGILNVAPDQYLRFYDDQSGSGPGIDLVDRNVNSFKMSKNGTVLLDKFGNKITTDTNGIIVLDKNNNKITMSEAGVEIDDDNGNTILMDATGVTIDTGITRTTGNLVAGNGASGSFTTPTGLTVTVQDGIITNIY